MLYSVIGNYSLLLGLFFGLVIFYFSATKILAKHDENYMPPEVKAALEEK